MKRTNSLNPLTQKEIDALKSQYGKIYKVVVCGTDYVIRPLYKDDWARITQIAKDNPGIELSDIDDKIVEIALLGPKPEITTGGWSTLPAGVIPTLSKYISAKSGFIVSELAGDQDISIMPLSDDTSDGPRPTEEEITTLKLQSQFKMRLVGIDGSYFVVRPITRQEWRSVIKAMSTDMTQSEQDALVTQRVVVWPKTVAWDDLPAGYSTTLAQAAMEISGYTGPTVVEEL